MIVPLLLSLLAAPPADGQAREGRRGDWMQAYDARRDGRILPLREIERRVVPTMAGAQYLGFEFEGETGLYTLKFLRDGVVIWVDVDGRSGQIVRRMGR
jgi:hypothetical protein